LSLSRESYDKWVREHSKLREDLVKTSEIEEKVYKKTDLKMAVLSWGTTLVSADDPRLSPLQNLFGKISNI